MPHKLSLLVPGLCGPLTGLEGVDESAGPLVELLKQFSKEKTSATACSSQLAELFGLKIEKSFPYAALTLLAHDMEPGDNCWIHADPVNLQADQCSGKCKYQTTNERTPKSGMAPVAKFNLAFSTNRQPSSSRS